MYTASGFNMEILKELENRLNFTTSFMKGNGSWSAMVNMVHQKKLDFAATGFSHVIRQWYWTKEGLL